MEELKPCPFCGGEADFYLGGSGYLQCTHCLAMIPYDALLPYAEGKKKAIAAWNRRAAPENKALTLDQLRQMEGEPVWINADHYGIYADVVNLVGKEDGENWVSFAINYRLRENGYGRTWLAYARKPEGSCSP